MIDIQQLQQWLDELSDIPKPTVWDTSLMDIIGIKDHETLWSYIYAFFFSENEQHNMGDLFIRSLEQLIGLNDDFISDFSVDREKVVKDDKRIDLLLCNKDDHRAIIIENKVNHILDNDLNLYYNSIKKELGRGNIVKTIVLGLHHYNIFEYEKANQIDTKDKYSITHKQLLDKVFENLPLYLNDARIEFIYLLKEFYKNINNMDNQLDPLMLDFVSNPNNTQRVALIHDIYSRIIKYASDIMECKIDSTLKNNLASMGIECKSQNGFVKYFFPNTDNQIMLTVFYRDRIFSTESNPHIHIVLEVQKGYKQTIENNDGIVASIINKYEGITKETIAQKTWRHLASQTIKFNNLKEELPRLGDIVGEYISKESAIIRLGKDIIEFYNHKNIA